MIAAAAAYYYFYWRAPTPAPVAAENSLAAPPAPPAQFPAGFTPPAGAEADTPPPAPADQFDRQALVQNPAGYAIVRSAPTDLGLTVARVNAGETVSTYAQSGDYWRVRTAIGPDRLCRGRQPAPARSGGSSDACHTRPGHATAPSGSAPPAALAHRQGE